MQYKSKLLNQIIKKHKLFNRQKVTLCFLKNISKKQDVLLEDLALVLGISKGSIYSLKKGYTKTAFVNLYKPLWLPKEKVAFIKIEMANLSKNGGRFYSKYQIKYICSKYDLTVDEFLRNVGANSRHYKYNKLAFRSNEDGFWVGKNLKMSNEIFNSNCGDILKKCRQSAYKACNYLKNESKYEDFVNVSVEYVLEKCGVIERNFRFNKKLMLNIMGVKLRYVLINYSRQNKGELYYENGVINIDKNNLLADNTHNPENVLENQTNEEKPGVFDNMDGSNKRIIEMMSNHLDMFFDENIDRSTTLDCVANKLGISVEKLEQKLEEIKKIVLEKNRLFNV